MSTSSDLTTAIETVNSASPTDRALCVNLAALRVLHEEKRANLVFAISTHPNAQPLDIPNGIGHIYREARNANEFFAIDSALKFAEALPETIAAESAIAPLVAEVRRLEAKLQIEEQAIADKTNLLRIAELEAAEKARIAALSDPAVTKAKQDLAKLQPATA
jgi:hypothetical protein